jgi:hypothetical protein
MAGLDSKHRVTEDTEFHRHRILCELRGSVVNKYSNCQQDSEKTTDDTEITDVLSLRLGRSHAP